MKQNKAAVVAIIAATALVLQVPNSAFAADATPAPTVSSAPLANATTNYQQALTEYASAVATYNTARSAAGATVKGLQASYQAAQKAYNKADQARTQAVKAISLAFATDVQLATRALRVAQKAATTAEAKNVATSTFNAAVAAASSKRDTALGQLLTLPDVPAKPFVPMPPVPAPIQTAGQSGGSQQGSTKNQDSGKNQDSVSNPQGKKQKD